MRAVVATSWIVFMSVAAAPAHAGTYDVWGCRLADGTPTEVDGWSRGAEASALLSNECSTGRGLGVGLDFNAIAYWAEGSWRFSAPPGTEIDNFTLRRAVAVSDDREYHLYRDFDRGPSWPPPRTDAERCITWFSPCGSAASRIAEPEHPGNVLEAAGLDGTVGLTASLDCQPRSSQSCPAATEPSNGTVRIWSSRIGLEDVAVPTFTKPPAGSLVSGQPLAEFQYVAFAASDRGGGIRTVGLLVDGVPYGDRPVDPAASTCKPPYTKVVPCPLAVEPTMVIDTRDFTNGTHTVRVTVTDAGGNVLQSDPFPVIARNGGQPNGANASRVATLTAWFRSDRAHRTAATVAYGRRRTIDGRLVGANGQPIAAAVLDLTARAARPQSAARRFSTVVTDRLGRFRAAAPPGSSREIRVGYRAYTLDEAEAASATLTLNVRAGVRLAVSPRRVRNGTRATFAGRLLGSPGRLGTQVTIYALAPRRAIPVETVSADRRGRFHYRYRFGAIGGPTRFRFQAVVKPQPSYPYARGASGVVDVAARP